ncbi:class II aldolase/adducin family protein [Amycolatopsis sp. cmx-4-68]|uniref:class II aldolase/adducin family protein n=1 Tax=Amycolatopsis sp. cmx-4-68 TaxID=2790938 RepID=UPI00397A0348
MPADPVGVVEVGRVVAAAGLVTAFGHVSRRLSATSYEITGPGDLAALEPHETARVDLGAPAPPADAPGESWLHTEIYRARPDVGGIVRAQPVTAFAAAAVARELRPVHGQAAWLGATVPVFPTCRLVRDRALAVAAAEALRGGHALLLRGNGAVTVGADPQTAAARMGLLDAACDVWLRARPVGSPAELDGDDLAAWAAAGPPLLDRLWATMVRRARI